MAKVTLIVDTKPQFEDIKKWHETHLHPSIADFDDPKPYEVYEKGRWCGIFQCTGQGAQRFFVKGKPKSIIDIAALTSVYRPGPLAAGVDKLWLQHEKEPYDWGHPLINETLSDTRSLLVFQEGVMKLANKVAGFPLAETDEVRRAIMKRSISGGEEAKKKMKEMDDAFINGCIKNGIPEPIAKKAYETICWMSGYGFNKCLSLDTEIDVYDKNFDVCQRKKIQDIKEGDYVLTRSEKTKKEMIVPVKALHLNGKKKIVKVTLKSGQTIKSTLDHKFRTIETGEMLPLYEILEKNLSIYVREETTGVQNVEKQ